MHNNTKSQSQIYLSFLFLILSLTFSVRSFSQTQALEMASITPAAANGRVNGFTVPLQKNTDNTGGNTFTAYSPLSPLNAAVNLTLLNFTNGIYFGDTAQPAYQLLNAFDNVDGVTDNDQYTSYNSADRTGIDIASNYGVRINANFVAAGTRAGNGRIKLGEITITFARGTTNPLLHFKGLGGSAGTTSITAEFTVLSVLNSVGTNVLGTTTITRRSGNLNVNDAAKTINNDYILNVNPETTNSARGTVQFTGNDVRTVVLEVYGNRNGVTATNVAWTGVDTFLISTSLGEVDLSVSKTVDSPFPTVGSNVVFNIAASNFGTSASANVVVNDLLPSGYTYVSHSAPAGTTYNNGTGVWTIGTLGIDETTNLTITATVQATGVYGNTATISRTGAPAEIFLANNSSTSTPVPFDTASQRACINTARTVSSLSFQDPVFESGSNNSIVDVGDVYRFPNVVPAVAGVSTAVDALLTVSALSGTGGTPTIVF
jgi:uncharacterized repeat protein (TIGR01451 family)